MYQQPKDPVYEKIAEFEAILKEKRAVAQTIRDKRIKGEAKVEQLKKNEQEFIDKIKAAGLDPENLKAYIIDRQKKLAEIIKKLDKVFPDENGKVELVPGISERVDALDDIPIVSGNFDIPNDVDLTLDTKEEVKDLKPDDDDLFSSLDSTSVNLPESDDDLPF